MTAYPAISFKIYIFLKFFCKKKTRKFLVEFSYCMALTELHIQPDISILLFVFFKTDFSV